MGKNSTPISFNTVKHSNRKARLARQTRGRVVLLAICAIVIAIVLTLAVFLCCSIVDAVSNKLLQNEEETNNTNNTPVVDSISYIQITRPNSAVNTGELIAVNKEHAYVFPSSEAELLNIYDNRTKVNGSNPYQIGLREWKMNKAAFAAFDTMMAKYYELSGDSSTQITSAYRTYDEQNKMNSSISAGNSEHHTGYCVSLQKATSSGGSREKLESDHWIYQNAHKYGFIVRYPDSKADVTGVSDYNYCFRYIGVAHASYIYKNNLALEEYLTLLKTDYAGDTHLKIDAENGNRYEVYYVPAANGELTTVSVPENYAYTISGDNIGGFIVTVDLSTPIA